MERPASVTVFGILNIVFAAFGLVAMFLSLQLFNPDLPAANNPVVRIIRENQTFATWMKVSLGIGTAGCAVLIASGIGLLNLRSWGRKWAVGYSIFTLVLTPVGMVFNYIYVVQPVIERANQSPGPEATAAMGGAIGGLIGSCIGAVYPILTIIFMRRKNVVEAFQRPSN